jgi:hypothetical protein
MASGTLPTRIEGALADRPVIRFDGQTSMTLPPSDQLGVFDSDYEIMIVARSSADGHQYLIGDDAPETDQHALSINGDAGASFTPSLADPSGSARLGEVGSFADGLPHLFNVRVEEGLGYLSVDGRQSPEVVEFAGSEQETGMLLASAGDPLYRLRGDIAEVLVYSSSLDANQRLQLHQHLADQWGIVLVPEPSGLLLLTAAVVCLLAWGTRKRGRRPW